MHAPTRETPRTDVTSHSGCPCGWERVYIIVMVAVMVVLMVVMVVVVAMLVEVPKTVMMVVLKVMMVVVVTYNILFSLTEISNVPTLHTHHEEKPGHGR